MFSAMPDASEKNRGTSEGPADQVTVPKPFAVDEYEVKLSEQDACTRMAVLAALAIEL